MASPRDAALACGMMLLHLGAVTVPSLVKDSRALLKTQRGRQHYFDNLRFFLEAQVMLAHFCQFGPIRPPAGALAAPRAPRDEGSFGSGARCGSASLLVDASSSLSRTFGRFSSRASR